MHLKRTALPITGICLSLLIGCEPTHIKNGFESEAEMAQLNGMGYEKFEHFQNRGNFNSPERAREALAKGFKTNEELNADYLQTLIQRNEMPQKSGIRREDYDSYTEYASAVSAANRAGGSKTVSSAATSPALKISNVDEALNVASMIDDDVMRDRAISAYRMMRIPQKFHVMGDIAGIWTYPHLTEAFCDEDAVLAAALTDSSLVEQPGVLCTTANLETLRTARAKQAKQEEEQANAELLAKQQLEKRAKDGGWSSVERMKEAEAAGFSDRDAYIAHLAEQAKKKAAAELERQLVKAAREAGEMAVEYRYCRYSTWGAADSAYGANLTILNASDPLFMNAEKVLEENFLREDRSSDVQQAYLAPQQVFKPPMSEFEMDLKSNSRFASSYYRDNCIAHARRQCQGVELRRAAMEGIGAEDDKSFAESQVEFWCGRIQNAS